MRRNLHDNNLKVTWQWVRSIITLWELLTKCQTVIFIMYSSDELPCLPTDFISTWWWVKIRIWWSTSGKPLYTKYTSWISVAFPKVKARVSHSWCWMMIKKHSYTLSTRRIQEPKYLTLGDKLASIILCNDSLQRFLHNWWQNTLCIVLT
jgi:hypothetical protein